VAQGGDLLFTGHSLGCTMSQLMAIRFVSRSPSIRAICFAPGGAGTLITKFNLDGRLAPARTLAFASAFDPIVLQQHQIGTLCTFRGVREPDSCRACEAHGEAAACSMCFAQAHVFKNYLHILSDIRQVPRCAPAGPQILRDT